MAKPDARSGRYWLIGGVAMILALILGANGHMLYVAVSSQPDCAEPTLKTGADGTLEALRPAKEAC